MFNFDVSPCNIIEVFVLKWEFIKCNLLFFIYLALYLIFDVELRDVIFNSKFDKLNQKATFEHNNVENVAYETKITPTIIIINSFCILHDTNGFSSAGSPARSKLPSCC